MSAAMAQGAAETRAVSIGLSELVRSLAGTFGRAQKRLALRQEQLLSVLRTDQDPRKLQVKLPNGNTLAVSPLELCTTSRGYLQDMVVDLQCRVEEVQTHEGPRLALRLLTSPLCDTNARRLSLWFAEDNPIKAELRFADEVIRTVALFDADLPSREAATHAQSASVLLLDSEDLKWAAKHTVRPVVPQVDPSGAATIDSLDLGPFTVPSAAGSPSTRSTDEPAHRSDSTAADTTKSAPSSKPDSAQEPVAAPPVSTFAVPMSVSGPAKRPWLRGALLGAMGLCLLLLLIGVGILIRHRLVDKQLPTTAPLSHQAPVTRLPILMVPLLLEPDVEPPPAGESPRRGTAETTKRKGSPKSATRDQVESDTPVDQLAIRVHFYATEKDGIERLSCTGQDIVLSRSQSSRLQEVRVLLKPGDTCQAAGAGRSRVYSYQELKSEPANANGERSRHIRFHKKN